MATSAVKTKEPATDMVADRVGEKKTATKKTKKCTDKRTEELIGETNVDANAKAEDATEEPAKDPTVCMTQNELVHTAWQIAKAGDKHFLKKIEREKIDTQTVERYETFSIAAEGILQKYEAALSEMVVRFEILDKELSIKRNRNPIHHIESRIKTPLSMYDKLLRYGKEPTIENAEKYLMDVAGVRVICSYIHDAYNILEQLKRQDDLEIVKVKDYIANPKPNGYRSLHAIVRIPVYFMDSKQMIPVEVQIRTIAMDFWASLEHDLKYKAVSEVQGIDSYDELKDCSRIIEDVEARMQILARALDE